jgi:hypothetical protein
VAELATVPSVDGDTPRLSIPGRHRHRPEDEFSRLRLILGSDKEGKKSVATWEYVW